MAQKDLIGLGKFYICSGLVFVCRDGEFKGCDIESRQGSSFFKVMLFKTWN
jgi:hypothetical protein